MGKTALAFLAIIIMLSALIYLPIRSSTTVRSPTLEMPFASGQPVFIRIFKETDELEVWLQTGETFELFKTYGICAWSGMLGPKLKEGDGQSPEGFYTVARHQLKPDSSYHRAFNIGFPNAYDRAHGRTGSFLMVHGDCVSIGCYAMTDPVIEEIYGLIEEALKGGQSSIPVHIFPFRMTEARIRQAAGSEWLAYWQNLKDGYDHFEHHKNPPLVSVQDGTYSFAYIQ